MDELIPPPPSASEYFLKTHPTSQDTPLLHAPLYLRLHGDGVSSVVLTPAQPKFLRWHDEAVVPEPDGSNSSNTSKQIAVPWKHPDRKFGLVVPKQRKNHAWEDVKIVEDEASANFIWEQVVVGGETLEVLNIRTEEREKDDGEMSENGAPAHEYKGWMACRWVHGYPQLFWVNGTPYKEMPPFCERVHVVREWLIPRE